MKSRGAGVHLVVEGLFSICEAPGSVPINAKGNRNEQRTEEKRGTGTSENNTAETLIVAGEILFFWKENSC